MDSTIAPTSHGLHQGRWIKRLLFSLSALSALNISTTTYGKGAHDVVECSLRIRSDGVSVGCTARMDSAALAKAFRVWQKSVRLRHSMPARTSTVMAMVEGRRESKISQLYALLPSVQLWKLVRSRHDILGPSCGSGTGRRVRVGRRCRLGFKVTVTARVRGSVRAWVHG